MNYQEERLILQGYKKAYRDIYNLFEQYSGIISTYKGFSKKNIFIILKAIRDNSVWLFENGFHERLPFLRINKDKKFEQIEIDALRPKKETKE